jgi:hypothetical protein
MLGQTLWPIVALIVIILAILIWAAIAEDYGASWTEEEEDNQ